MAAYAGLAFLSLLWGSSFLLIKIASRAFDPFDFALARVGVAAAPMLLTSVLAGKVVAGIATWTVGQTPCARTDRAGHSLLAAWPSGDPDHQRRHGADDGRPAHFRLSVRPLSGIARSLDVTRRLWLGARLRWDRRRLLVARSG